MKRLAMLCLLLLLCSSCGFFERFIGINGTRPISPGFTQAQVSERWGRPWRKRRSMTSDYVLETWMYSGGETVTFKNGAVWLIQT